MEYRIKTKYNLDIIDYADNEEEATEKAMALAIDHKEPVLIYKSGNKVLTSWKLIAEIEYGK